MASEVGICNRALQKLGAKRITSLTQDAVNARACNTCYSELRDAEMSAHEWSFAVDRVQLAADATAPAFGRTNAYQLPSDYLRLARPYVEDNFNSLDWIIEGLKIYTDDTGALEVRYVKQVTDPNVMHVLFREALAARMALEMCEELTQSNTKKASLQSEYAAFIKEARRVNAILKIPAVSPEDEWLTIRA